MTCIVYIIAFILLYPSWRIHWIKWRTGDYPKDGLILTIITLLSQVFGLYALINNFIGG